MCSDRACECFRISPHITAHLTTLLHPHHPTSRPTVSCPCGLGRHSRGSKRGAAELALGHEEVETGMREPRKSGRLNRKIIPGVLAGKKLPMAGKRMCLPFCFRIGILQCGTTMDCSIWTSARPGGHGNTDSPRFWSGPKGKRARSFCRRRCLALSLASVWKARRLGDDR